MYISLYIDRKEAKHGFDWYLETGNALYAVPDTGEKVELYIAGIKPGEMYIVRTFGSKSKDEKQKELEMGNQCLNLLEDGVSFNSDDVLMVKDKSFKLTGNGGLSISATGRINIKARNIRMNSKDDIVYVSE